MNEGEPGNIVFGREGGLSFSFPVGRKRVCVWVCDAHIECRADVTPSGDKLGIIVLT